MINIDFLKKDEAEIEFAVRGLKVGDVTQLQEQIILESKSNSLIPKKPHYSAYKNPRRELKLCGAKLNEMREWIVSQVDNNRESEDLVKLKSRILHVHQRLKRLSYSKVVKDDLPIFLDKTSEILDLIMKSISKEVSLIESVAPVEVLDLDLLNEDESDDELDFPSHIQTNVVPKIVSLSTPLNEPVIAGESSGNRIEISSRNELGRSHQTEK